MKKLIVSTFLALGILTAGGAAFAATDTILPQIQSVTNSVYGGPTITPTPSPKIDKNDPLYLTLKDKNVELEGLRAEGSVILESIDAQNQKNRELRAQIKIDTKAGTKANVLELEEKINALQAEILPLRQQKITLYRQLSEAFRNKDKETAKNLNEQLKAVNQQLQEKEDLVKDLRQSIKDSSGEVKELREDVKAASEQLKAINAQINQLHADILALRADKAQEWIEFHNAIKALDLSDANTHMDNILNYKEQIIAKFKEALVLKKQIEGILSGLLD